MVGRSQIDLWALWNKPGELSDNFIVKKVFQQNSVFEPSLDFFQHAFLTIRPLLPQFASAASCVIFVVDLADCSSAAEAGAPGARGPTTVEEQ